MANPFLSAVSQSMLMRFGVMIGLGKIWAHPKFYQVWLGNSQEKWICRLGWPFGKGNSIRILTTLGFLKKPFGPMAVPPSPWEPPWTGHRVPIHLWTVTLFPLPLGCGSTHAPSKATQSQKLCPAKN